MVSAAGKRRAQRLLRAVLTPDEWDWYLRTGACRFPSAYIPDVHYHFSPLWAGGRYDVKGRSVLKKCAFADNGDVVWEGWCFEDRVVAAFFAHETAPDVFHTQACSEYYCHSREKLEVLYRTPHVWREPTCQAFDVDSHY